MYRPADGPCWRAARHISCEPPAAFEDELLSRGHELVRVELDEGEPLRMGGSDGRLRGGRHPGSSRSGDREAARGHPVWGSASARAARVALVVIEPRRCGPDARLRGRRAVVVTRCGRHPGLISTRRSGFIGCFARHACWRESHARRGSSSTELRVRSETRPRGPTRPRGLDAHGRRRAGAAPPRRPRRTMIPRL